MVYKANGTTDGLRAQLIDLDGKTEDGNPAIKLEKVVYSSQQLDRWFGEQYKALTDGTQKNGHERRTGSIKVL